MADTNKITGQQKGGIARAESLSSERKKEIAQAGALARWGARATHKGNFSAEFGIDVDCYVLDDLNKTAVISKRGMATAIGLSSRGNAFPRFVKGKAIAPFVGAELIAKIEKPLKFKWRASGAQQLPGEIHGYDVTLLIDICKAITDADNEERLQSRHKEVVKQARIILNASAKSGIKGLVYALAGYDATRQEIIDAFKLYVRQEAREYEKEFPDQLYAEWYRLYELPKPRKNKPWKFKHLTIEHVYEPLANSCGKIYELTQAMRADSEERWKKLHQFLSEAGVKALRTQLGQTLGIARISDTKEEYEANIEKAFSPQEELFRR